MNVFVSLGCACYVYLSCFLVGCFFVVVSHACLHVFACLFCMCVCMSVCMFVFVRLCCMVVLQFRVDLFLFADVICMFGLRVWFAVVFAVLFLQF